MVIDARDRRTWSTNHAEIFHKIQTVAILPSKLDPLTNKQEEFLKRGEGEVGMQRKPPD